MTSLARSTEKLRSTFAEDGLAATLRKVLRRAGCSIFSAESYLVFAAPSHGEFCSENSAVRWELLQGGSIASRCNLPPGFSKRLRSEGVLAYCAWDGDELAHVSWACLNADIPIDPLCRRVDFRTSAYVGDCKTDVQYRGRGLYPEALRRLRAAVAAQGVDRVVLTVAVDNYASLRSVSRAGFSVVSSGRLLRLFTRVTLWTGGAIR